MDRVTTMHVGNTMSRRTVNRMRFIAGVGIAASGVAVLAAQLVGSIAN